MKQRNKIICMTMLLIISLATITPAMGSTIKADHQTIVTIQTNSKKYVTIDFVDCTNIVPVRKEVTMPQAEWISLQNDIRAIPKELSVQDSLNSQLTIYKKHNLISPTVTTVSLLGKFKTMNINIPAFARKIHSNPINNSVVNAMCAILLKLENGSTAVFGLNTFINLIGFDIFSFHKGYATEITTTGVLGERSAPAGNYAGTMFGFFGYWFGTKVKTGVYSDLTASGFTVFTIWLPLPSP